MMIRPAHADDRPAIHDLVAAAFGRPDEADLVDALRADAEVLFELSAVDGDALIGHILFSRLAADRSVDLAALAPVSVAPERQGRGVGAALVQTGLERARAAGLDGVIVLGEPAYYGRFGFSAPAAAKVSSPFTGLDAFMALEFTAGALARPVRVTYASAFGL